MKRLLLFTLLLAGSLAGSHDALAQKKRQSAFLKMGATFGIKGGVSIATLAGNDATLPIFPGAGSGGNPNIVTTLSSKIGITAGALFNYRFTNNLSIQVEGLYSGRGFKAKSASKISGERRDYNVSLQYLEVPLLAKLNAKVFYLEAGIVPSFLVASTYDEDVTPVTGSKASKTGQELPGINSFDPCWALGGGVELIEGGFLGLRLVRGSSSLGAKSGGSGSSVNLSGRSVVSSSVQITAGYIFNHSYGRGRGGRRH